MLTKCLCWWCCVDANGVVEPFRFILNEYWICVLIRGNMAYITNQGPIYNFFSYTL